MNYMTLLGTEQVQNAASTMRRAAEDMQRAANIVDEALRLHQRFMDDWLQRFENVFKDAL